MVQLEFEQMVLLRKLDSQLFSFPLHRKDTFPISLEILCRKRHMNMLLNCQFEALEPKHSE
jgi:hypothetical protein